MTPFAGHRQQHPQLTERFAPSLLKSLAEPRQIRFLKRVLIRPARLEILEHGFGSATSNIRDYFGKLRLTKAIYRLCNFIAFGKLRLTKAIYRLCNFICIGLTKREADIFRKFAAVVPERPSITRKKMFCNLFGEALRGLNSLFTEFL